MEKRLTIPNVLSIFRIFLIPVIVVLYFSTSIDNNYIYAAAVIVFSGFTDVLDGFIARKFNMTSQLGKILDPAADKLTQATVLVCLCFNHHLLIPLAILLFVKESALLAGAIILRKKEGIKMPSAKWWGKLSTVVIYATMFVTVLSDFINGFPNVIIWLLMGVSIVAVVMSFIAYYFKIYREFRNSDKEI